MTSREIKNYIQNKDRHKLAHTMWMAIIYTLYKKGYSRQQLASAFEVHPDTISYAYNKIRGLIEINDTLAKQACEGLKTHIIDLCPYYVKDGYVYKIKSYVQVDKIKL